MFSFNLSSQFPIFILLEMKSYEDKRLNKVNLSYVIHWIKLILYKFCTTRISVWNPNDCSASLCEVIPGAIINLTASVEV